MLTEPSAETPPGNNAIWSPGQEPAPRAILAQAPHPWPVPPAPWVMRQTWHDLLFAHWPVAPATLRGTLPAGLTLDTFDGMAWVGVVPFVMGGVRPRGIPPVPWLSAFPEINVRTYVTANGKPGVWFYSLDAGNPVAVAIARGVFHLPYFNARFTVATSAEAVTYASRRGRGMAGLGAFSATYRPSSSPVHAAPGSLAHFLTERYCLYTTDGRGRLLRGDIRHASWPLQAATAEITTNTLALAAGITLPDTPPVLHFARRLDVLIWWLAATDATTNQRSG
ncbi:MAG: DUF2071 domain-containing protein [Ktedonobacterales bacterium]|nr:DUF2071 domain-containing protein [Ktedonobacterales bacterium]